MSTEQNPQGTTGAPTPHHALQEALRAAQEEAVQWKNRAQLLAGHCNDADTERDDWKRRAKHNLVVIHELRAQNADLLDRLSGKGEQR